MFNACRRGTASLCRVALSTSSAALPVTRSSVLSSKFLQSTKSTTSAIRYFHISPSAKWGVQAQEQEHSSADDITPEALPKGEIITKFTHLAENGHVHHHIIKEITETMGHETMTQVQALTIDETLKGTDVIAQARTGTGKTLGFLIPVVQNILTESPELAHPSRQRASASDIRAIIISPTRELAEQIAVEAKKLVRSTGIKVQVAVGGNSKRSMLQQMQREGCHLLVATPGRLNDLLSDPYSRVSAPRLKAVVLDEADRLLDSGFSKDVEDIMELLPPRHEVDRQTLLFSATVPREVMRLVRATLKPDFKFVQTIDEGEAPTHEKIPQNIVVVPSFENLAPALVELCKRETAVQAADPNKPPFKGIVYLSATAQVTLYSEIMRNLRKEGAQSFDYRAHPLYPIQISAMHGKLTQVQRTRVSEKFRNAESALLISSDVTARGMDFPNVTHVIQVGLPPNRDQYIHRLGRTGRAGKEGNGYIMVTELEVPEARQMLRGLPIYPDKTLQTAQVDMTKDAQLPADIAETLIQVGDATKKVSKFDKLSAFQASLGALQSVRDKQSLIDHLYQWARYGWGFDSPPSIGHGLASKLGLSRVRGLVTGRNDLQEAEAELGSSRDGGRGGFGGRDGGRGGFGDRDGGRGFGGRDGGRDGGRGFGGRDGGRSFGGRDGGRSFGGDRGGDRRGGFGGDRGGDRRSGFGGDRRNGNVGGDRFERASPRAPTTTF